MRKRLGLTKVEFLLILTIIGFIAFIIVSSFAGYTKQSFYKASVKKAIAELNQSIAASNMKSAFGTIPYNSSEKLTEFFKINLKISKYSIKNSELYANTGIKYKFFSKGKCGGEFSTDNPDLANCVVLIDVNGDKKPNKLSSGNNPNNFDYKDQYKLIIKDRAIVPAVTEDNTIAQYALFNWIID